MQRGVLCVRDTEREVDANEGYVSQTAGPNGHVHYKQHFEE